MLNFSVQSLKSTKGLFLALSVILLSASAVAQHTYRILIVDAESGEPLPGANVVLLNSHHGDAADANGIAEIRNLEAGTYFAAISFVGYTTLIDTLIVPAMNGILRTVRLEPSAHEVDEIVVTTTRSSRVIEDIPTRVEVVGADELDEKSSMRSSDIRMQLNESTGIMVQSTSAVSGSATFRIQGLEGRYTQLLKDGFPLYAGFASGLSLLQIPPLDLRQIEIVKGSSSTLHGGGAIAGLVNLITKQPGLDPENSFLINGTGAGGLDVSGYFSRRREAIGWSLFSAANVQAPYDANGDRFSDLPKMKRFSLHPKFFYYGNQTSLSFGINSAFEVRSGGAMSMLRGESSDPNLYVEQNTTDRISSQLSFDHVIGDRFFMNARNSVGHVRRTVKAAGSEFSGAQWSTFSEVTGQAHSGKAEWIFGLNLWTDDFREMSGGGRDISSTTFGSFVQYSGLLTEHVTLETGIRIDRHSDLGSYVLPRVSLLLRINPTLTSRLGGGTGYKTPTIFTEESENAHFNNVRPLGPDVLAERSFGVNWDVNYRMILGEELTLTFNQLFYYTRLDDPLSPDPDSLAGSVLLYRNSEGFVDTKGFETNVKISLEHYKLLLGYTFGDPRMHDAGGTSRLPLTPMHRLNVILLYEIERKIRVGLEFYYTGSQELRTGGSGRDYWISGLMIEKQWEPFSFFLNFENFTDTRQSRFGPLFAGPEANPVFVDLYAPLEGFVINAGFKVRF
ncbi:MAG: TonB-dependent receptor [Bacteroidota bacterium]